MNEDHDILIELKTDVKYIRKSADEQKISDTAQWKRIDQHTLEITGLKESKNMILKFVTALFGAGGLVWGVVEWLRR